MEKKQYKIFGIKQITAMYSVIAILILTCVLVLIGYHLFGQNVERNYKKYATTVLEYAYTVATEYSFGDMIAAREMPERYEEMREHLNKIKESSDIGYLYAVYFEDINNIHSITYAINTKTAEELAEGGEYTYMGKPCEAGSFEDETLRILQGAVKIGQRECGTLDGYSSEYGHMLNGYKVIFDSNEQAAGLLCVEIDVNDISKELNRYVRMIALFAAAFTLIVTLSYISAIEHSLINPITSITRSAKDFIKNIGNQRAMDESAQKLAQLDIHAQNEVGDLYRTISKMETDMAKQLRDLRLYSEKNEKMQNGLMVLMADMVETRDSDTGNHIQKTAAYVKIILEGLKKKGYYKELLPPEYIQDVIKSAPLHDVGKINISDTILNKPGKLTPEEFEIMKTHATWGKKILDKAIRSVGGENFLREARNMAAYHHERWDGKGYPEGLKGEEIPLSARIMAVADVFDALTSARVYKPAFPLEEAIRLIEEENGTKYDSKCVEVFFEAIEEVKAVIEEHGDEAV
ncbi:MAG: HD domain-containing protein [Lachnospiraceae bacterium]|nr:HD domain-containing protein [Lachnospiraceae bacterium]